MQCAGTKGMRHPNPGSDPLHVTNSEAVDGTRWKGLLLQHTDSEYISVVAHFALRYVILDI